MLRFILVCLGNGFLFGMMDGLIHANPLAVKLYEVYKPIARTSINVPVGIVIDILYGFAMGGLFLLLYQGIPGGTPVIKGLCYGLIIWFFRVVMSVVSSGMMYRVPFNALFYSLIAGLGEMLIIGFLYGLLLKPME